LQDAVNNISTKKQFSLDARSYSGRINRYEEGSGQKGPDLDDDVVVFVDADENDDDGGSHKSDTRWVLISTQIKRRTFIKFD
jgi:hypothetical protein